MHRPMRDDHRDEDQRLSARHAPLCRASPCVPIGPSLPVGKLHVRRAANGCMVPRV